MRSQYPTANILIAGDFNLSNISWSNTTLSCEFVSNKYHPSLILNSAHLLTSRINYNNLYQYNYIYNCNNYTLDLVFSNLIDLHISPAIDFLKTVNSHHSPLTGFVPMKIAVNNPPSTPKYNFSKCNYVNIIRFLNNFDWLSILNHPGLDTNVARFYNILYYSINLYVPTYSTNKNNFPLWFTNQPPVGTTGPCSWFGGLR